MKLVNEPATNVSFFYCCNRDVTVQILDGLQQRLEQLVHASGLGSPGLGAQALQVTDPALTKNENYV